MAHRKAKAAQLILECMARRHSAGGVTKIVTRALIGSRFTDYDMRELCRAIDLLDKTDLRTRKDKGTRRAAPAKAARKK